jgi:hypothetical protein
VASQERYLGKDGTQLGPAPASLGNGTQVGEVNVLRQHNPCMANGIDRLRVLGMADLNQADPADPALKNRNNEDR